MIRSMTGYSTARTEEGPFAVAVTLKGTNHRYLDIQLRLAGGFDFLEPPVRRLVAEHVRRGHLELAVTVENRHEGPLNVNRTLLEAYLKTWQSIRQEYGLSTEPDVFALFRIPGIVNGCLEPEEEVREQILAVVARSVGAALCRFNEMREREGDALAQDLWSRLQRLSELGRFVSDHSACVADSFRKRLEKRVRELAKGTGVDPGRMVQEITILAIRSDITEELTRFSSHIEQARELLKKGGELGKRLDFLMQELNREANTMLSKTTDVPEVGAKIASASVEMKVEVEKLREQAQNIE